MNLISTYRICVVALCTLLCVNITFSQDHSECGFHVSETNLKHFQELQQKRKNLEDQFLRDYGSNARIYNSLTSLPIKAHVVRNTNGSGGLSENQLNDALAIMNGYYSNAGLEFFLCDGINYINDTDFYNLQHAEQNTLTSNNIDDVINIYFVNSVYSSSGSSLCGLAYYPGGPETIIMANSCTTNGSTLSHEMGHFFGLFHTHGNSNVTGATNELVNGSNCDSSGDYICDTPADPKLSSSIVNSSCIYTGSYRDDNNELYDPQTENIMSYSRKVCRTFFSPEQYARINSTYLLSRTNLACPSLNADFVADVTESCDTNLTVAFTESSEGATSWSWDVDGDGLEDYNQRNITHTYNSGGLFDVALTVSNNEAVVSKVKYDYIDVGADEISTTKITLELTLDNWPIETTWQFVDGDDIVVASGGPYQQGADSNQTITETISIDSDLCYRFEIFDSFGDGICCNSGNGNYQILDENNNVLASGGDFTYSAVENFFNGNLLSIDTLNKDDISVYPNPTTNQLNISLSNGVLPNSIEVYNTLGQRLLHKDISMTSQLYINTKPYKDGLYFVKLTNDYGEVSIPFIKR